MNRKIYNEYVTILESELVPALGCTEPIALAYAAAKAKEVLGWNPRKTSFEELVKIMVKHDLDFVEKDHILKVRG